MNYEIPRDDDFQNMGHIEDDVTDVTNPVLEQQINEPDESEMNEIPEEPEISPADKLITTLLKNKGIVALDKVLYEEGDEVVEKNFYDLPEEDQLNILAQNDQELTDEEIFYITQARENNIGLTDLIQYYVNQSIQQQLNGNQDSTSIADYTDEELYVLDLKAKLEDSITDEEILKSLEKELESPEIFKKKVEALRKDYLALEEQEKNNQQQLKQAQEEEGFNEFKTSVSELINNVEDVGGVVLETEDKNEILNFMIQKDPNGVTEFAKQLRDPENLFLQAWAILKAKDTFDILKNHYESQLKLAKKSSTTKTTPKPKDTKLIIDPKQPKVQSIEDLNHFE